MARKQADCFRRDFAIDAESCPILRQVIATFGVPDRSQSILSCSANVNGILLLLSLENYGILNRPWQCVAIAPRSYVKHAHRDRTICFLLDLEVAYRRIHQ